MKEFAKLFGYLSDGVKCGIRFNLNRFSFRVLSNGEWYFTNGYIISCYNDRFFMDGVDQNEWDYYFAMKEAELESIELNDIVNSINNTSRSTLRL